LVVNLVLEPKSITFANANILMFVRDAWEVTQLTQEIPENVYKIPYTKKKEFQVSAQDSNGTLINKNSSVLNVNPVLVLPVTDKTVSPITLFVLILQPKIVMNTKCSNPMIILLKLEMFVSILTDQPTPLSWPSQFCLSYH